MDPDQQRMLLCGLGATVRDEVITARGRASTDALQAEAGVVAADVIYGIDRIAEPVVERWIDEHWPDDQPLRLVMEGIEDDESTVFPSGTDDDRVRWVLIVDPIDGTRSLMYDKRSAWVLSAVAPASVAPDGRIGARLGDVVACAMTEIPTTRAWRADQYSCVAGRGPAGIVAVAHDVRDGTTRPATIGPSTSTDLAHGFASFCHALPDGKAELVSLEQQLWDSLWPPTGASRAIFEDQYLCSGGQIAEVLCGRDRLVGDLRPLVSGALACHPYDICTSLLLTEAGGLFEAPDGGPVDCPLDTTTPVAWVAYANADLASMVRPALAAVLEGRDAGR